MAEKKKKKVKTSIPKKMYDKIMSNKQLTPTLRKQAFRIIQVLLYQYIVPKNANERRFLNEYLEIPSNYWGKVNPNYHKPMKELVRQGIVERNDSYKVGSDSEEGRCKAYRLNTDLIDKKYKTVKIEINIDSIIEQEDSYLTKKTKTILRKLKIDKVKCKHFIKKVSTFDSVRKRLKIDDEISELELSNEVWIWREKRKRYEKTYKTHEQIKTYTKTNGLNMIKDGRRLYLADKNEYIKKKSEYIDKSYTFQLNELCAGNFFAKRNDTNQRLDTNLTNLPSLLIAYIILEVEELINIDLSNSQLIILSYLIKTNQLDKYIKQYITEQETTTVYMSVNKVGIKHDIRPKYLNYKILRNFVEFTENGTIYNYISGKLGFNDRDRAKKAMFEILFSSHKYHSKAKTAFGQLFPVLKFITDAYKKEHGDSQLAILLQKTESRIFIDGILTQLLQKGFKVLTKHDSVLCKKSDAKAVYEFVSEFLTNEIGKHTLKIEDSRGNDIKESILSPVPCKDEVFAVIPNQNTKSVPQTVPHKLRKSA